MAGFDEEPLDLLEDDDDGVIDTMLFCDEDEEASNAGRGWSSGCGVILLAVPSLLLAAGFGIFHL